MTTPTNENRDTDRAEATVTHGVYILVCKEPGHLAIEITKENFQQEVLDSELPVLLDLWAAWCGPCRLVAPVVDELASEYAGRIKVGKMPKRLVVTSVPK